MIVRSFEVLFWISFFLLLYPLFLYLVILYLAFAVKGIFAGSKAKLLSQNYPSVSVIVAACNEEKFIKKRIQNILNQDYPKEKLEVIIASDGSTDRTAEIAKKYESKKFKVLDFPTNRGRAALHNDSVKVANGEILVFTDAETIFEENFLKKTMAYFSNPAYGLGSGEICFKSRTDFGKNEGIYWTIEKRLRWLEYRLEILPFVSGACFCLRKELHEDIKLYSDIDNILNLKSLIKGYKVFYAKEAKVYDYTAEDQDQFYRKRKRTVLRSMSDYFLMLPNLLKAKKFMAVFVLLSHRLLKWWGGFFLIGIFISNVFLIGKGLFYAIALCAQMVVYFIVLLKHKGLLSFKWVLLDRLLSVIYSFIFANVAFIKANIEILHGYRMERYAK